MREVLIVLLVGWSAQAQHGSSAAVNPYTSTFDAAAGASVYRGRCAGCHGIDASGTGAGPSLNTGVFRYGRSDEDLFLTITKGVPGTAMPAFSLSGKVTWQLVSYLRTLAVSTRSSTGKGNAAAGEKLFASHCAGCHRINGSGGSSGPDLSEIAALRSDVDILDSLVNPGAVVSSEYWSFAGRTREGKSFRGTRLNEDTHSIQIRDDEGRLISLRRQDVAELELVRKSPMPSFHGKLTEPQMDDIIAWLARAAKGKGQ
jgi:cytochrome c oxidase cbb3-type subunit III